MRLFAIGIMALFGVAGVYAQAGSIAKDAGKAGAPKASPSAASARGTVVPEPGTAGGQAGQRVGQGVGQGVVPQPDPDCQQMRDLIRPVDDDRQG